MKQSEQRENLHSNEILVEGVYYDEKKFMKEKFNGEVAGVIRIKNSEYDFINQSKEYITHFNLEVCGHKVDENYVLPRILKHGFFTGKEEQLPDLSFKNVIIGKCIEVREFLSYDDLKDEDFEFSFQNIKNVDELKKAILSRYSVSMPNLSKEKILSLGVSLTKLKILKNCSDI